MYHDTLGEISFPPSERGDGIAEITYADRSVRIRIFTDGDPLERCLALASDIVSRLEDFDRCARQVIVDQLLDTYNSDWRISGSNHDGSERPLLSAAEFQEQFDLIAITIMDGSMAEFYFNDPGLFGEHAVIVNFPAAPKFDDAQAELFG